MLGSADSLFFLLIAGAASFSALGIIAAHTGSKTALGVLSLVAWFAFAAIAWTEWPLRAEVSPLGLVVYAIIAPIPSVVAAAWTIARGQWRPAPTSPRRSLIWSILAFLGASPVGFMAGFQFLDKVKH